jgi:glycolate oxidase FAD binding subunit
MSRRTEAAHLDFPAWLKPADVAAPADTEEAAAALAEAARTGAAVLARGNATKLDWAHRPERCDLLLDTRGLHSIDHAAGDLVVTAGAGTPLDTLQAHLAEQGQRLTADPPVPGGTVGGMVATGLSGGLRLAHGAVRDLIIGMSAVRADGVVHRSGGRVVKNVAGYDLAKLHTGAYGTLGVITSVTFRLHPLPEACRTVRAVGTDPRRVEEWLRSVRHTRTAPSAVQVAADSDTEEITVEVLLEGASGGIAARAEAIAADLGGGQVGDAGTPADMPGTAQDTWLRIVVPPARAVAAIEQLRGAADREDTAVRVRGCGASAVLFAAVDAAAEAPSLLRLLSALRAALRGLDGTAEMLRPSEALRSAGVDLWGEVGGLALMRAVKHRFDPEHRLAPGRFGGEFENAGTG